MLSGAIARDPGAGAATLVRAPTLLGESALVTETTRRATATAREPPSALRISRALFHRVLAEYPDSAARLHGILTERLVGLADALEGLRSRAMSQTQESTT